MSVNILFKKAQGGFKTLDINPVYVKNALKSLKIWLTQKNFKSYFKQIEHLILSKQWEYLLDSFYQVIPFGTGGRRGEVGIGPNRINLWTIKASAQGHAQYLLKKHGDSGKTRGVVLAYDVRKFFGNKYFNDKIENPARGLTSSGLSLAAAETYAANGIKVHIFDEIRTTPELSFAIRYLNAVAGCMFSASHNPPDHNGKKIYDEFGGQLIPPFDEDLVSEVTKNVKEIKTIDRTAAIKRGLIQKIDFMVDKKYIKAASSVSLSDERNVRIIYTPLHGCGMTSVYKALKNLGFDVLKDPKTSNPSGKFENITFNIPNPEVVQSFDTILPFAQKRNADIILSSDPDADRMGAMVKHNGKWFFLSGNEIATILTEYVIQKRKNDIGGQGVVIKTSVTTDIIKNICEKNRVKIIGDLLVGFKYIADAMNILKTKGHIDNFLFACEESHGFLAGNYARDKDAVTAAVWLSELAAELKGNNQSLIDYMDRIYSKYGYFKNYLTEIRLLGARGKEKIDLIQKSLRKNHPRRFGRFEVKKFGDCWKRKPIVSGTDRFAKNVLIFHLKPIGGAESIKVTIRPSGTEPKIKMYFEVGTRPVSYAKLAEVKKNADILTSDLEKAVMVACYKIIGVDFPKRGFLLFWQLPLEDKLKYFEVEPAIERLKNIGNDGERRKKFSALVSFLGSNPVEKMDEAFLAKYRVSVLQYLDIC